ncbi:hypothetical protein [Nocardia aurantiaca]|uniref:Uncharacterized protein n=1 Tax=Nocardia aurantiaca TaxID=2675850 RepID=A0A6I3L0J1_9NOCA|nr:hypothetical protein [Nocardia aurantiaca]MTE14136.1 hypothetical protein [Nocardia aurantiaca]
MPVARCVPSGKIRHATQRDADLALSALDRTDVKRRERSSYRCAACGGWHLTSWVTTAENYVAVASPATAGRYQVFPLVDYSPTSEITRKPMELSSIPVALEVVPTPAEVAARTVPPPAEGEVMGQARVEPLAAQSPPSAPPIPASAPPTIASKTPELSEMPPPPAPTTPPAHTVPSPAEVAARTVPIKRAEAARRQAEANAKAAVSQAKPASGPIKFRNMLHAILRRLMRRLRRS